jgi:hypothetical protein
MECWSSGVLEEDSKTLVPEDENSRQFQRRGSSWNLRESRKDG